MAAAEGGVGRNTFDDDAAAGMEGSNEEAEAFASFRTGRAEALTEESAAPTGGALGRRGGAAEGPFVVPSIATPTLPFTAAAALFVAFADCERRAARTAAGPL